MNLEEYRQKIDKIDSQLLELFIKRIDIVKHIAQYKKDNNLPITNNIREQEVIDNKLKNSPDNMHKYVESFFANLLETSKSYQLDFINNKITIDD